MDNNHAEQAIRLSCVGKKNWVKIDAMAGAESGAIIYAIMPKLQKRITERFIISLNII